MNKLKQKEKILALLVELSKKKKPIKAGYHIFYKLLDSAKGHLSNAEIRYLLWVFVTNEKALNEARKTNINSSNYFYDNLFEKHKNNNFSSLAKNISEFILYPGKAFYYYHCTDNYVEAICLLKDSIDSINKIKEHGYPEMLLGSIEQYINLCRVLIKQGEISEGLVELSMLSRYLFKGEQKTKFCKIGDLSCLIKLGIDERIEMIDYVTDVFLTKCFELDVDLKEKLNFFKDNIGQHFDYNSYFENYYNVLDFITNDNLDIKIADIHDIKSLIINLYTLPNMLQFTFLSKINTIFQDTDINNIFKEFTKHKLGLGTLLSEETPTKFYSKSPFRSL